MSNHGRVYIITVYENLETEKDRNKNVTQTSV